jgi:excisionase family DNA binding protein
LAEKICQAFLSLPFFSSGSPKEEKNMAENEKPAKPAMDTRQAAKWLQCSEATVRKLCAENRIAHYKVSKRILRFDPRDLLDSIRRGPKV